MENRVEGHLATKPRAGRYDRATKRGCTTQLTDAPFLEVNTLSTERGHHCEDGVDGETKGGQQDRSMPWGAEGGGHE